MNKFLVFGNPIAHSKSPIIHNQFAVQLGESLTYDTCLLEVGNFEKPVLNYFRQGLKGANVTLPFKESAFNLCDRVTDRAKLSRAVNTLYMKDGVLCGDNTDGEGLVRDLTYNKVEIANRRILIIGAGGAARGCIPALLTLNPQKLAIANRTVEKAQKIVNELNEDHVSAVGFDSPGSDFDVVINATSSSVNNSLPVISESIFNNAKVAYDMFYTSEQTSFMKWAKQVNPGITTIDGLGMLVEQAAEAFKVWLDKEPDTGPVRELLRNNSE